MTISPSLAGLPILTPTTGDELVVRTFAAVLPPMGIHGVTS